MVYLGGQVYLGRRPLVKNFCHLADVFFFGGGTSGGPQGVVVSSEGEPSGTLLGKSSLR